MQPRPHRILSVPSRFRRANGESPADSLRSDRLRRSACGQLRSRAVAGLVALARILIVRGPLFFPSARRQSSTAGTRALDQPAFAASPLHIAILRKVCSVAEKISSPPSPPNPSLLFHSYVERRPPPLHNQPPAYQAKALAWPEWSRPCSLFLRAGKSGEPYIELAAPLRLPGPTCCWKGAAENDCALPSNLF